MSMAAPNHAVSPEIAAELAAATDAPFTTEEIIDASAILSIPESAVARGLGNYADTTTASGAEAEWVRLSWASQFTGKPYGQPSAKVTCQGFLNDGHATSSIPSAPSWSKRPPDFSEGLFDSLSSDSYWNVIEAVWSSLTFAVVSFSWKTTVSATLSVTEN
jgi:hypothetical protein